MLSLQSHFEAIEFKATLEYAYYKSEANNKKQFAELINKHAEYRPVCFAMWDGKKYDHIIWKLVKPEYEKPFWSREAES